MECAFSSVCRRAGTVLISGTGAPALTTIPTGESASSTREPAAVLRSCSSFASASPTIITTSAFSPRASRAGMACGVLPIDGPEITMSLSPLCASYCGVSFSSAALKPPEIITVTSCASAPALRVAKVRAAITVLNVSMRDHSLTAVCRINVRRR